MGKAERKKLIGYRWEDEIETDLGDVGWGGMNWHRIGTSRGLM
jgi:hypothetical protein